MINTLKLDPLALGVLSVNALQKMRQKCRALQMLDAAERASLCPIRTTRLHGLAYLADVLSPVWGLPTFDGTVLKLVGGPHYPDFQRQLDELVILSLVSIRDIQFDKRPDGGARLNAEYSLNFQSLALLPLLEALGTRPDVRCLDPADYQVCTFLLELAGAIASIPDEEISVAASLDATFADSRVASSNLIDFGKWATDADRANLSVRTVQSFADFMPEDSHLSDGEKLYLYASFLGRRVNAA